MDWREAETKIGAGEQDDYILDLATHQTRYETEAPEIAKLLNYAGTTALADSYADYDRTAIAAQSSYRRWMFRANFGVLLTSVLSAGAMAWRIIDTGTAAEAGEAIAEMAILRGDLILSVCAVGAAALGSAALYVLRNGRLLETWMTRRANAESHRIGYFASIVSRAVECPAPTPILALEYFKRYQFDVQKTFFLARALQHEKSAEKTVWIGATGAIVASLSTIVAIFPSGAESAAGAAAVLGGALGAFAIGREQMTQDRRNAERYLRTHASLVELTHRLDDVREGVVSGHPAAAREFAAAVGEQVSNEHRQWLEETKATEAAVARIEAALKDNRGPNEKTS